MGTVKQGEGIAWQRKARAKERMAEQRQSIEQNRAAMQRHGIDVFYVIEHIIVETPN